MYKAKWKQYKDVSRALVTASLVHKQFSSRADSRITNGEVEHVHWRERRISFVFCRKFVEVRLLN
jgi:hypothetical protein